MTNEEQLNKSTIFWRLVTLVGLAFTARLTLSTLTEVPAKDGVLYIEMADKISRILESTGSGWSNLVQGYDFHPLYPLLIALFNKLNIALPIAGIMISVICGTLAIIPFYFLTARIFNHSIARISSIVFAFQPYLVRFSADVISDSTYVFFFLFAIWLCYEALRSLKSLSLFMLAGIFTGLAYMTRPEGIGIILIVSLALITIAIEKIRSQESTRKLPVLLKLGSFATVMIIGFLSVSLLYMNEIGGITKKKSVIKLIGVSDTAFEKQINDTQVADNSIQVLQCSFGEQTSSDVIMHNISSGITTLNRFIICYHYPLAFFFVIGLFFDIIKRNLGKPKYLLIYTCIMYLLIVFRVQATAGYSSNRHVLPMVVLMLPWCGLGIIKCSEWIAGWIKNNYNILPEWEKLIPKISVIALTFIVVITLFPKTFKKPHNRSYLKSIAEIIEEYNNPQTNPKIISPGEKRIAILAKGTDLLGDWSADPNNPESKGDLERIIRENIDKDNIFIIVNSEKTKQEIEWLKDILKGKTVNEVKTVKLTKEEKPLEIMIFQIPKK